MATQKEQRLTDKLNLAISKASSAVSMGKGSPDHAVKCCELADVALHEAMEILCAIRRAAESI